MYQKLRKLVESRQSYCNENRVQFFGPPGIHAFNTITVVAVTWPWPRQRFGNFSQGSRCDYPWNMPVKFEVRTFSRFGAISI